jgi:phosphopantetheine--protein transferase-like protein
MLLELPENIRIVGNGCDTETCSRLARAIKRHPTFMNRWFSQSEIRDLKSCKNQLLEATIRFSLKEAAIKALWRIVTLLPSQIITIRDEEFRLELCSSVVQTKSPLLQHIRLKAKTSVACGFGRPDELVGDTITQVNSIVVVYVNNTD